MNKSEGIKLEQTAVVNAFRVNMKRLREEQKMSQEEVAKVLHIARPVISNWERGSSIPSLEQLVALAHVFRVSVEFLLRNSKTGNRILIVDTSILIKRPRIIHELLEVFDKVVLPQAVITELNYQKDNAKKVWLKKRAWLVLAIIDEVKEKNEKLTIIDSPNDGIINDEKIAKVALQIASEHYDCPVYMFANDIYFPYLVEKKLSNLQLLTYDEYLKQFSDFSAYDIEATQNFMALMKNREFNKIIRIKYNPGININFVDPETGYTPLIQAVRYKNIELINYLLETYKGTIDIDCPDRQKYAFTPLLHTAQMQNYDLMKLLLDRGADIDAVSGGDNSGNTPLMVCAWHGFYKGVELLLNLGACVNQQDDNGFTALIKACIQGHPDIVRILIEQTDIDIRSRENKKAKDYIKPYKKNAAELYDLFRKKEAAK
jgi:transcriptional regulator with XRE-family HTH domain